MNSHGVPLSWSEVAICSRENCNVDSAGLRAGGGDMFHLRLPLTEPAAFGRLLTSLHALCAQP